MEKKLAMSAVILIALACAPAPAAESLLGHWTTGCIDDPIIYYVDVDESSLSVTKWFYPTRGCTGSPTRSDFTKYLYETDDFGNIDFSVQEVSRTYFNLRDVAVANEKQTCSYSDWSKGKAKDLTNNGCGASKDSVRYDVFKVTGSELRFGMFSWAEAGEIGSAFASGRPDSVDDHYVLRRAPVIVK